MADNWKFPVSGTLSVEHLHHPIKFLAWSGNITYFSKNALQTINLQPDSLQSSDSTIGFEFHFSENPDLTFQGQVENRTDSTIQVEKVTLNIANFILAEGGGQRSVFKQGFQSWSETHSFSSQEREMVPFLPTMTVQQSNNRNPPTGKPGEFTSDMVSIIADLDQGLYILFGQLRPFNHFFYVNSKTIPSLSVQFVFDFGGKAIPPHAIVKLDPFTILVDTHANRIMDRYMELCGSPGAAHPELPVGWCSWYYYFTKITQKDISENLAEISRRKAKWQYFILDDGYETAVGDWLSINPKFPSGLQEIADQCKKADIIPGIWLAPFIARGNSRVYRDHPDWFLKNSQNKPAYAGWNPGWGLEGRYYGLDTTHPEFQEYINRVIHTFVHEWGFQYLKLDFTYGASLYGKAFDGLLSAAERLKLGYRLIRQAAGPNTFILGCGSPISPAIDYVDAMRIGEDTAPYWLDNIRYHLTNDPNALCAKIAIRSILNRAQFHRQLWINDPDCLLVRDSETKLNEHERLTLVNAAVISGGMLFFSDRLSTLDDEIWPHMEKIRSLISQCDQGRTWPLDFMETPMPGIVYNSAGFLAVFNFSDRPAYRKIDLSHYLPVGKAFQELEEIWSGEKFNLREGILDLGEMPPHSSHLFTYPKEAAAAK